MEYQLKGMDSRVVDSEIIKALVEVNSELETNLMDEGNNTYNRLSFIERKPSGYPKNWKT